MEPFYSIDDLADLFDFHTPQNVADALKAAGVPMIYNGENADLSGWRRDSPQRNSDGAIVIVRGRTLNPDPDEVMVAYETLPPSWRTKLDIASSDRPHAGWEGFDSDSPTYPPELDIALQAWRAISITTGSQTPKQRIAEWLNSHYQELSEEAKERITVIANWDKKPGARTKGGAQRGSRRD